ncbi:MAG: GlsB/YeaQ/YmgE family stress response membrane protein [Muribaculaceae bacterium]|nr:GlsB/YeaQ/YmgE family stress response membrane protein [Muribaculaceae bacterium]
MSFIWYIIIGLVSGFIAGKLMRGGGFGVFINLIVGIIGGVLGGWVFSLFGIHTSGIIGSLITSVIGAIILLWLVGYLAQKTRS